MLVTITQTFDTPGRRWLAGENPDVDASIARQWIADGKASLGPTPQNPYPVSGAGGDARSTPSRIQAKADFVFPTSVASHNANRNTHIQITLETDGDEFWLNLLNAQAVAETGVQVSFGVSNTPIVTLADMNAFVPSAFVNVTFAASSSGTIAAGVSAKDVTYTQTDHALISTVAALASNYRYFHIRIFQPSANANVTVYGATPNMAWAATAADGRTVSAWYKDGADTSQGMPAWGSGAAVAPRMIPFILQYKSRGRIRTLGSIGDSLAFGQGGVNYGDGYARELRRQLSTPARPIEFADLGMPGATTSEFTANLTKLIALGIVPHWSILHAGSPNDVSTTISDAQVTTMYNNFVSNVNALQTAGAAVFAANWMPSNSAAKNYGASDSKRVAYNQTVLLHPGANGFDVSGAVSGATVGGQVQIAAGMANADGLHINDTGKVAQVAVALPKLQVAS